MRRRRHEALASIARRPTKAISFAVWPALDILGHHPQSVGSELFCRPLIVTNNQYRFLVAEQGVAVGVKADIMLEPMRRDSGPAIAAGVAFAAKRERDGNAQRSNLSNQINLNRSACCGFTHQWRGTKSEDRSIDPFRHQVTAGWGRQGLGLACEPTPQAIVADRLSVS